MAFIIDAYNRRDKWDREHAVYTFDIQGNSYAILQVNMLGKYPMLPFRVDDSRKADTYYVYETQEQAMEYVYFMKRLDRSSS